VEYQIENSQQLSLFYNKPVIVYLINYNKNNEEEVVGYCQLDPRLITEKAIICPILSCNNSSIKLGDI
jgi:hypothetical protein